MVDFKEYFEISDDDDITCDLCNKTWDGKYFEALNGVNHLMSAHGIGASYESKASERLSYKDAWDNLDTFKREGILMNGSGGNYEYEEDELVYVNHSYDQLPQHITQLVNEYMDYKGHTLEFNDLSEDDKEFLRKQYPDKYGSESKANEDYGDWNKIKTDPFTSNIIHSSSFNSFLKEIGAYHRWETMTENEKIYIYQFFNRLEEGQVTVSDYKPYSYESKASEGYVNIDDDGFYNPIGISDVPSIIGGIAKGYGKKLVKPFQEDKSGDWEIQVKDDNGGWKTYEYGGHYGGKDGADHDAKNLSRVNRVVRKGSGYESKSKESSDVFLYEPTNDVNGVGYWWDFELPLDENKERKTFEDLDIQYGKAWGYLTQDEKERVSNYKSKSSESTIYKESWNQANSIKRIEALEKIGIKQGDAIKLSSMEFEDFGEDLQDALKGDIEDARTQMKQDKHELDGLGDYNPNDSEYAKTTGLGWQEGGEVENPNSEFQQYYPDYNNIGESQTNRTKYECEYCDHGFKSNEALMVHHNDKHAISKETLDGYATEDSWASPMINKGQTYSKSLHSDYKYGINDELILICDICGWEAGIVDRDNNDDSVHDKLEEHIASVHNIVRDYWAESYVRKAKYTGNEGLSLAEWSKIQDENGWYRVGVSGATPEIEDTAKAMGGSWHGQGGDGYNVTEWTFHNHSDAENFAQYVEGKSITIDHGTDHADYGLDSRYLPMEQHYVEGPYDASPYVFDSTGSHNIGSGAIGGSPLRDNPFGESRASEYMSLIGDTPEQYWSMGGLNSIEEDLELYNEDSQNASSYPIYSKPDTTKLWSDLSDQEKSDIQTLFHFMSGGGETDFYDQESYSKASEMGDVLINDTPYGTWTDADGNQHQGDYTQSYGTSYTDGNRTIVDVPDDKEKSFGDMLKDEGYDWIEDQQYYGYKEFEKDGKYYNPTKEPPWNEDEYEAKYGIDRSMASNRFRRGESKASETKAEIAYWWNDMSPYERENIVDEYGVGHGLYDGDYNKTYDQIENDGGDQFNRAEIDAIFTNHVINKQTGLDRKDLIKDQSDIMSGISGMIPSNTWDDTEYDYFYKHDDQGKALYDGDKIWGESKASEYDSMGMWDEMEVWWNSLPTSEQRDIIAKRGEGWELDRIDENGWETDFASLTDLQGDIVAPEYRVRNGLPEWSDVGLGTLKESKASEGRTMEQVWNQSSPSQRESIMIEGGVEYEETGQSYFGDDGNDSDSLLHNLDDSGTDSGRWSAQNKSAMDSLSNTSYDNLPINIRNRVDNGIISYGLNLEGESKASEDWDTDMAEKTNKNMKKQFDESLASEAGLEDHSCPECGFITSDNSEYVDHLNAHEE